jgi:hypothetical protein
LRFGGVRRLTSDLPLGPTGRPSAQVWSHQDLEEPDVSCLLADLGVCAPGHWPGCARPTSVIALRSATCLWVQRGFAVRIVRCPLVVLMAWACLTGPRVAFVRLPGRECWSPAVVPSPDGGDGCSHVGVLRRRGWWARTSAALLFGPIRFRRLESVVSIGVGFGPGVDQEERRISAGSGKAVFMGILGVWRVRVGVTG